MVPIHICDTMNLQFEVLLCFMYVVVWSGWYHSSKVIAKVFESVRLPAKKIMESLERMMAEWPEQLLRNPPIEDQIKPAVWNGMACIIEERLKDYWVVHAHLMEILDQGWDSLNKKFYHLSLTVHSSFREKNARFVIFYSNRPWFETRRHPGFFQEQLIVCKAGRASAYKSSDPGSIQCKAKNM